ncbi:MAG: hypothetical protein L3J56_06700 [Bacteroidales bacterium]|nr:hypothetical protein [Bacteroidales bacterium]
MKIIISVFIIIICMAEFVKIPSYSLSPDKITLFERIEWYGFSDKQRKSFENLKNNESKYNELSSNARKRLLTSVNYLLYLSKEKNISGFKKTSKQIADNEILIEKESRGASKTKVKFKLTFITLTLSAKQVHSDKEITRTLLGSFLDSLRRKWKVDQYIWKAEKQENGNIHYHILTNKFIHWEEIREVWNRIQNKDGFNYVDKYSSKMQKFFKNGFKKFPGDKRSEATQRKAYEVNKKTNWTNPNSTDIHALYKVKNVAAYIAKYVSKPVTKTSRTQRIDELILSIEDKKNLISHLKENELINDYSDYNEIEEKERLVNYKNNLKTELSLLKSELKTLKEKGVTGRIWGQSRTLSKIKSYSDVENFSDIPNIQIVEKIKRYKSEIDIGFSNKIITYYFDIDKTPQLKQILNDHISRILNGDSVIDKLTFDKAETIFYQTPDVDNPKPENVQISLFNS